MSHTAEARLRLLLIEDDDDVRESLDAYLSSLGYAVDASSDGREGLQLALAKRYDAIICDLHLPGLDGLEIGRAISALPDRPYLIAHTAFGREEDYQRTKTAGFDYHITKGRRADELERTLELVKSRGRQDHP
jgi:CheY-like chemotaxis protein